MGLARTMHKMVAMAMVVMQMAVMVMDMQMAMAMVMATVMAMVVVVAARNGFQSGLFGLALLFAAVVMYDAVMVRRSSGEQGKAITALIKEQGSKVRLPRVAMGHTPLEVVVGALVGVIAGLLVVYLV